MSNQLINQYYTRRERIIQFGGSTNELSIRDAFKDLLNHYADKKNLLLIPELAVMGTKGAKVKPDGTLKNALRLDYGYWESKDEKDSIDDEIDTKLKKGYPQINIIFEDGQTAVLIQHGVVVARVNMNERDKLDEILNKFISFEHPQVKEFTEALGKFKEDLPNILEALRELMITQAKTNTKYLLARDSFLEHCRLEINPEFTADDVREMMIQHILTEEIFNAVFDETHFHRENNIALQLEKVLDTFFTGETRRNTLDGIKHYYSVISNNARNMADHHEKQKFLKIIYENFYKTYNPKAADRLGVVYTPNEVVNFMIESTDYLLQKHFGKTLADKNVEILDPATGTGTFICDIIDYIPKQYLPYKYKNEIHANEVAILPYYVANLNIEYTYKQKMGLYEEFPNLCFVDTLDNTGALKYTGLQTQLFGFSSENAARIKRQNEKKISVIIGNPPYNANQKNENENNKNREYPEIDKRIKETFIKNSTAQKTKLYDMYARFYRWSMDRVDINYEEAKEFPLKRIDIKVTGKKEKQKDFYPKAKEPDVIFGIKPIVKVKLKADKSTGTIEIDDITTLSGVPKEAWEYKLGNRSAIEWILDQYKEKKPKDPTIAEKFNCYHFADYKEEVIQLLKKITTVSLGTMKIISQMDERNN